MNNQVNALVVDRSGNLYAGGAFTSVGGVPANYLAKWNGSGWLPLGSGMNNQVNTLVLDSSGNLYAGGVFTSAGGLPANYVAKWNGRGWLPLGSGMNNQVNTLVLDSSDNLYAGGVFTSAGGLPANYVAKWNGSGWSPLGDGLYSNAEALAVDSSGNLYAGGFLPLASFYYPGSLFTSHVAGWNGSFWYALPDLSHVSSLAVDGAGNLYAGGNIFIVKLSGSEWIPLGSGINGALSDWVPPTVNTMLADSSGNLYVGGAFTTAGGLPVNSIAVWNGAQWAAMGSGVNNPVNALALDASGSLYAGGRFTTAGSNASTHLVQANVAPGIGVQQPAGTYLLDGASTVDFGTAVLGSSITNTFVVTNIFTSILIISNITITGANASDFTVGGMALPLIVSGWSNTVLTVAFRPSAKGMRSAMMQVCNSSTFNGSFVVNLSGIGQQQTTTTVTQPFPLTYGNPVTLAATVTPTPDGGTIQFYDNAVPLGDTVSVSSGSVTGIYATLPFGTHPITATYSGTIDYSGSSSAGAVMQQIEQLPVHLSGSRIYDGTPTALAAILTIANAVGDDQVTVVSGSGTLAGSDVGVQPLTSFGTLTLRGSDATNYTMTAASGSVTITEQRPGTSEIAHSPGGVVSIVFRGSPGGTYLVQASTDLITWSNISTNLCGQNGTWSVTNSLTGLRDFFRASTP